MTNLHASMVAWACHALWCLTSLAPPTPSKTLLAFYTGVMAGMNLGSVRTMLGCSSAFWFLHTRRMSLGLGPWPLAPPTSPLRTHHSKLSRQSCCSELLVVVFRMEQCGQLLFQCDYLGTSRDTILQGGRFLLLRFVALTTRCTYRHTHAGTHSPMTMDLTAGPPSNRL